MIVLEDQELELVSGGEFSSELGIDCTSEVVCEADTNGRVVCKVRIVCKF